METDSAETLSNLALAFGDSYTIEQRVAEGERHPVLLEKGLTEAGIETQDRPRHYCYDRVDHFRPEKRNC